MIKCGVLPFFKVKCTVDKHNVLFITLKILTVKRFEMPLSLHQKDCANIYRCCSKTIVVCIVHVHIFNKLHISPVSFVLQMCNNVQETIFTFGT